MVEITGVLRVMRWDHRDNRDEAISAVGIQTPRLSECLSLHLFLYLIYLMPNQPEPHLEEDAHCQDSMPCPG